jgi:hypothetical protein
MKAPGTSSASTHPAPDPAGEGRLGESVRPGESAWHPIGGSTRTHLPGESAWHLIGRPGESAWHLIGTLSAAPYREHLIGGLGVEGGQSDFPKVPASIQSTPPVWPGWEPRAGEPLEVLKLGIATPNPCPPRLSSRGGFPHYQADSGPHRGTRTVPR